MDFDKNILPQIFELQEQYFLPNIKTNLQKNYDFANRQLNLKGS